jgi:hypothetical protein
VAGSVILIPPRFASNTCLQSIEGMMCELAHTSNKIYEDLDCRPIVLGQAPQLRGRAAGNRSASSGLPHVIRYTRLAKICRPSGSLPAVLDGAVMLVRELQIGRDDGTALDAPSTGVRWPHLSRGSGLDWRDP